MAKPLPFTPPWPKALAPSYGPYAAVLDRWIDGDTGLFIVDLGFGITAYVESRVLGLSCADRPHPERDVALMDAYGLLNRDGRVLLHTTGKKHVSTFSRWVARVELEHGLDYATAMNEAGHHLPHLSR